MRGHGVLRVSEQPHRGNPFIPAERRVLEDRSDLERKLLLAALALPYPTGRNERRVASTAAGARHISVRPADRSYEIKSPVLVREVRDRLEQGCRRLNRCVGHASNCTRWVYQVCQCPN